MAELKPCPFCGSTATEMSAGSETWFVECDNCGVYTSGVYTATNGFGDPIEKWNRRAQPSLAEAIAEVEKVVAMAGKFAAIITKHMSESVSAGEATCKWILRSRFYQTECDGYLWEFAFNFCPRCGKRIELPAAPVTETETEVYL